jgi:hypothetical protein
MNQLIAVCILLFMTSEGFASKSAEKISEKVLARVLSQVVASKPFEDYKAARGLQVTKPALISLEVERISAANRNKSSVSKGTPAYEYQVIATYALNSGQTCRLYMPVTTKDGGLSFGTGHSDGGCGE